MARRRVWLGQLLDAVTYTATVTAVVFAAASVVSFFLGFDWVGVKVLLFYAGFLAFGYATFTLWPTPPWKKDEQTTPSQPSIGEQEESRIQALAQELPPARFRPLPVDERLPIGVKLFLASLAILGTSFVMETVFGVAAATA